MRNDARNRRFSKRLALLPAFDLVACAPSAGPGTLPELVEFHPGGRILLVADFRASVVRVLDTARGLRPLAQIDLHHRQFRSMAFSPDGDALYLFAGRPELLVVDLAAMRERLASLDLDLVSAPG